MVAYLPYKCKQLCMSKFLVVSLSLTKSSIYIAYSSLYNQSDNMISVMYRTFHCSLHVSV